MVVFVSVRFRVILLKPFKDAAAAGLQFFYHFFQTLLPLGKISLHQITLKLEDHAADRQKFFKDLLIWLRLPYAYLSKNFHPFSIITRS